MSSASAGDARNTSGGTAPPSTGNDDSSSAGETAGSNVTTPTGRHTRPRNPHATGGNDLYYYKGATPEFRTVLALRTEKVKTKEPYEVFVREICDYIGKKLDMGTDLESIFIEGVSPLTDFDKTYKPDDPRTETDVVLQEVLKEEIKIFAKRRFALKQNVKKVSIFGVSAPQCYKLQSEATRTMN